MTWGSGSGSRSGKQRRLPSCHGKIVKTAELGIRTEAVRESAAQAQRIAAQFGGSVLSSRISQDDGSIYADLVLSIPSPEFEKALDELRGLGKEVT
ncbi:MAG: DUF4349 domain-containing protein, partial [Rubrobacter sp.]|nr:DUF4349 domain-containing protein [Rubrobacter sp.]